jgi:uncharacterized protein (DUF2141 family)
MSLDKIITLLLFALLQQAAGAQGKISVDISNARNNKGVCRVCLFNSAESFKQEKAFRCVSVGLKDKKAGAVFAGVPPGTYAVFVLHDANNNSRMDKNFLGIPSEGYGASRNNLPFAAAPSFDANKFSVDAQSNVSLAIRLRNL